MTLFEKLTSLCPGLTHNDFVTGGTITIGTDNDGNEVIVSWNHPTFEQPTQEDLDKYI